MIVTAFVEANMAEAQALFDRVKRRSPGMALKLLIDMHDFVLPRLQRTEFKASPSNTGETLPAVSVQAVLDAWRAAPRPASLPAPQPSPAAIPAPLPASTPPLPIAAPGPAANAPPEKVKGRGEQQPVIDTVQDEDGTYAVPPPPPMAPAVARVFGTLSHDGCDSVAIRRRAEATVRARFRQEAQLEREMGRPARAAELLAELAAMGLE